MANRSTFYIICLVLAVLSAIAGCWFAFHDRNLPLGQFCVLFSLFWLMIRSEA